MTSEFHTEDLLDEYGSLPLYLHETKDAVRWTCQMVLRIRMKQCGREEIAWLLGIPLTGLAEALPSSADAGLIGTNLLDLGFLPRGAGCVIQGCKSMYFLNGRKCTLCKDLRDGVDQHARVIVEGGTGEEQVSDEEGLRKTVMIARKNLDFAAGLETDGWPSLSSLNPEVEPEAETQWSPSEVLGDVWQEPARMPVHLQSADALIWLTNLVSRLVDSKSCGQEEVAYLLSLRDPDGNQRFGGSRVPRSLLPEHDDLTLDLLGFIPAGTTCIVEGCNSKAHLNGKVGKVCIACPDTQQHVKLDLGEGEIHIARKNLRLPKPPESAPEPAPEVTSVGNIDSQVEVPLSRSTEKAPVAHTQQEGPRAVITDEVFDRPMQDGTNQHGLWNWWPLNLFCCVSNPTCCKNGMRHAPCSVVQDDDVSYTSPPGDVVQGEFHLSSATGKSIDRKVQSSDSSLSQDLSALVQLKVAGSVTDAEFQTVKTRLLNQEVSGDVGLVDGLQQLSQLKASERLSALEHESAKRKLLESKGQGKSVVSELVDVLNLRAEGFLTDVELAVVKEKLLSS